MQPLDVRVKTAIAGDAGIGKTEFSTIVNATPPPKAGDPPRRLRQYDTTIGVDFHIVNRLHGDVCRSNTEIHDHCKHVAVSMKHELWDTAGTERFHSIVRSFYRDADIVIFAYDLTKRSSFEAIQNLWYPTVECVADTAKCQFFMLGTKADLLKENGGEMDRGVSADEVYVFANEIKAVAAFETDAVQQGGWHAYETFTQISALAAERTEPKPKREDLWSPSNTSRKKGCRCSKR